MKRIVLTLVLLVAFCACVAAQDGQTQQTLQPFDSFGDILMTDWLARLDNFTIRLQQEPTARAYIVAYPVKNGFAVWPFRRAQQARGYLVKSRGMDKERVEVLGGEFGEHVRFELWVVRAGERLPFEPPDLKLALAGERAPLQVDRYYIFGRATGWNYDGNYDSYADERDRFESFVSFLRADPALRGCIIAYTTRRARRGSDLQLAVREKRALMSGHSIAAERVVVIGGGVRAHKTVELWLVPPGSPLPRPTPTAKSVKPKRR